MTNNITHHHFSVTKAEKERSNGHKGTVLWLCGPSGSGKSTLANMLEKSLFQDFNFQVKTLDGDNTRLALNSDLGFTPDDRKENLRRVAEVAKLFVANGSIVICSFITPLHSHQDMIRSILGSDVKIVFLSTPLSECELRDPKGLYAKARKGEIKDFTGVNSPFENPKNPDLIIDTATQSVEQLTAILTEFVRHQVID